MTEWVKVCGTPYSQKKVRGNKKGLDEWSNAIVKRTKGLPRAKERQLLEVLFVLPSNKFPKDHPHGNDLDNLTKRFMDALQMTVLKNNEGGDGIVVEVRAGKCKEAQGKSTAGAWFRLTPHKMVADPEGDPPVFI